MVTAIEYGISSPVRRKTFSRMISETINRMGISVRVSSEIKRRSGRKYFYKSIDKLFDSKAEFCGNRDYGFK
jgi:hypothetical protein